MSVKLSADTRFVPLNEDQRQATGRNDRPLAPNNLVIQFRMENDAEGVHDLVLNAPTGFVFDDDCLSGTGGHRVFDKCRRSSLKFLVPSCDLPRLIDGLPRLKGYLSS